MIDALVKVAEKLVELAKYQELKRQKRFKAWIEPMFAALTLVHRDYLLMFDQVRLDIRSDGDLQDIASRLQTRRLQQEPARRVIEAKLRLPGPSDSEEDAYFLECIRHYFRVPLTRCDLGPVGTASFVLSECLRKGELRALAGEELASIRIEALSAVQLGIGELRFRWENVASAYAEALAANS